MKGQRNTTSTSLPKLPSPHQQQSSMATASESTSDSTTTNFHPLLQTSQLLRTDPAFRFSTTLLDLRLFAPEATQPTKLRVLVFFIPSPTPQAYAIQPLCPHAGAPLETGDIEDVVVSSESGSQLPTNKCIVCPAHHLDFNLLTGNSENSPAKAKTWPLRIADRLLEGEDGSSERWIEIGLPAADVSRVELARRGRITFRE